MADKDSVRSKNFTTFK